MSAQVFISHSSEDAKVARAICTALENRGLPCWIASRDVGPGENFQEAIVRAIRGAQVMVLVFTERANNSGEIKKELVLASQNNLVIIPARAENVAPNDALAYEFATRQWVDLFHDWEHEIERLGAWIARIVASEPAGVSAAHVSPAAAPGPTQRAAASSATVSVGQPTALSRNPLHHTVGTFLLIVASYLLVLLAASVIDREFGGQSVGTTRAWTAATVFGVDCEPLSPRSLSGQCVTDYWSAIAILFVATVALIFAGLGTIRWKRSARVLGLGLCAAGFLFATYLTVADSVAAYDRFTAAPTDPLAALFAPRAAPVIAGEDPMQSAVGRPHGLMMDVVGAMLAFLVAAAFAAAGVVYIWGWQSRLTANPNAARKTRIIALAHRDAVFGAAVVLLCAVMAGAFYLYQLALNESQPLWLAVLIAIDALVFIYCAIGFRKQFGSAAGTATPEPVRR